MAADHFTTEAFWNGRRLRMRDEAVYHAGLRAMKLQRGAAVQVRIEKLAAARTRGQNANYWGYVIRPVALYSGMAPNDIHRWLKAELLPAERFTLANAETGEVKLERALEAATTTRLSEPEFDAYVEHSRARVMEVTGIDLSDRGLFEQFGIMRA